MLRCWIGVDIFFVLSGFLIGRMLFIQLQQSGIGFKAFYIRRTFRIFPAYYVMLTLSIFVFAHVDAMRPLFGGGSEPLVLDRSWQSYLYISNYTYRVGRPSAMPWGWSLCIEEHFYLLLPALLALLFRWTGERKRLAVLIALTLAPAAMRLLAYYRDPAGARLLSSL
jgi:peptidoglycan/LPS O-acetylase OafA/YrhL